jgi:DNA helicase HerA-like ATPase
LREHTFITGSTGSGKSNTVYAIIARLNQIEGDGKLKGNSLDKKIPTMIIEPAKGEYKQVFGDRFHVYGTNPDIADLLRINPFKFEKKIHVLEHIDRLIDIFNVCWPMYAAMPAVLKEAVEKSYVDCGWNLTESTNEYGSDLYPTFADVTRNIRTIIDSSEYDAENKGAYKGSLITRLKSLTNGINGLIFTTNEINSKDLFDENVIVDLSRVGSAETKSLIMGLLVLKLQEYRMTSGVMNAPLVHVTVLEEAHNLLKRTSTEQSQESGNLQGKSVEMLTNSIAEMRTYGEGFIIADQAPALLDMAVIRNTNTKIIMRLPDQDDRELVGKAANLNDDQIIELAKLPRGVAAVYQNEWVEPVLCKIKKSDVVESKYEFIPKGIPKQLDNIKQRVSIAKLLFSQNKVGKEVYEKDLKELNLCASSEVAIRKSLINPPESPRFTKLAPVIKDLFPSIYFDFKEVYNSTTNVEVWTDCVDVAIKNITKENIETSILRDIRQCIITQYVFNELANKKALEEWLKGGVK